MLRRPIEAALVVGLSACGADQGPPVDEVRPEPEVPVEVPKEEITVPYPSTDEVQLSLMTLADSTERIVEGQKTISEEIHEALVEVEGLRSRFDACKDTLSKKETREERVKEAYSVLLDQVHAYRERMLSGLSPEETERFSQDFAPVELALTTIGDSIDQ